MEGSLLDAVRSSNAQEVAKILANGADPNEPDELGETPIFEATAVGHADTVALLLMSRADPEYRSPQGMVARQMALEPTSLLLDLCSGRCSDTASWEEGLSALSAPLRMPFAKQFQVAAVEPPEEAGEDQHPFVQHETVEISSPTSPAEEATPWKDKEYEEQMAMADVPDPSPDEGDDLDSPVEPVQVEAPKAPERGVEEAKLDSEVSEPLDHLQPDGPSVEGQNPGEAASPQEDLPTSNGPANVVTVATTHVVLHSPMIAVRKEPCMRSVVLRYLRPGDRIDLVEWDGTHQWRRVVGEDAWVPVRHPTLGILAKAEGKDHFEVNGKGLKELTVQEAWKQLYEGGILNIPPPNGQNASSIAGQALVEAATGKAPSLQGEKALASLDLATVEYVMTAALQHLHLQN